jgi:hypothetical protein
VVEVDVVDVVEALAVLEGSVGCEPQPERAVPSMLDRRTADNKSPPPDRLQGLTARRL